MTWYLVAWVAWNCPGGWLGNAAIPAAARPLACQPAPRTAFAANRREAVRLLLDHPGATLEWCERLRCRPRSAEWQSHLVVDGKEEK